MEGLEPRAMLSAGGLLGTYFNNSDLTGSTSTRIDAAVDFEWHAGSPAAKVDPNTYSVRWTGRVRAAYSETYTFHTTSDDGVRLWIGGRKVIDYWRPHTAAQSTGRITLQAGHSYDVRMEYYQNAGLATVKLEWSSASQTRQIVPSSRLVPATYVGMGTGLSATYFNNSTLNGSSATRVDPTLDFKWKLDSPAAGIASTTYSAQWLGQIQATYSDVFTFYTTGNDGIRLWIDGRKLIDNWKIHSPTVGTGSMTMQAGGKHNIRMEYQQNGGESVAKLEWSSASQARQIVPASQLYPAIRLDTSSPSPPVSGAWQVMFHDEFNGSILDPVWHTAQYWNHANTVVGDDELQAFDATGVSVGGGLLRLTAREDSKYGVPYVSGLVSAGGERAVPSSPTFSFLHGYMEVRAKLPAGQGLWPAIWMLPASYNDSNAELDAVEVLGKNPSRAYFTTHRHGHSEQLEWDGPNLSQGYHTFGVDWQTDHVSWFVDGVERARTRNTSLISPEAMYPIMNLSVGGIWAGSPNTSTRFPASMSVDYIRIWQKT